MLQKEIDLQCFSPAQAVQKAYLRQTIKDKDKESFRLSLSTLLHTLDPNDREGANKGCVKTFLESTFWKAPQYKVGEKEDIDLAISDNNTGNVVVMFEFKRVGEEGMVKKDDLNRKALYELVLYYLLEEKAKHNHDVRHLVISDGFQYFIFEKGDFWKYFASDNKFANDVLREENDKHVRRDYIYKQIIKPKAEQVWHRLAYTYVDLRKYMPDVDNADFSNSKPFNAIYKLFSPTHMLNLSYQNHYDIDNGFYRELLYIMGLQEVADKDRRRIKRMPEGKRVCGSLTEQAFSLLEDFMPGEEQEGKRFDTALGLVMLWVNRVIFIRLLETQLVNFNGGESSYGILKRIDSFGTLYRLFFNVLAIPEEERTRKLASQFRNVPYLNSSLFELSDVEKNYFSVNALSDKGMPVMDGTILKDHNGHTEKGEQHVLSYLLRFLDAYDFGSNQGNEGKTLISSAVLGLIFEKVNGYRDGSYFTSGDVTADMCHNVIRRAVVDKFNGYFGWNCSTFDDLKEQFDYSNAENRQIANRLINSIRLCDPSVGSGHFLVASLNEFIVIKRELNVLCAEDGSRMKAYRIAIENDELVITDENDEFHYEPKVPESQKVQKTLFEEKRKIIENCLFGVDINAKSAEICQLRLWIELLKNAYYYKDGKGTRHLQTLPNIDINIKTGNSLVMQQKLDTNLNIVLAGVNLSIEKYRADVAAYKKSATKADKHKMNEDIKGIKSKIRSEFSRRSKIYKDWVKAYAKLLDKTNDLFADTDDSATLTALRKKEQKLRQQLDSIKNDNILNDAFEWRYEFPEILDENGKFVGFDIVIGNPPYGVKVNGEYRKRVEANWGHMPDYEIYYYFLQLALAIIKPNGYAAYIIPNTWMFNVYAEDVRKKLLQYWHIIEVLDCTDFSLFDKATVRNTIITMQRYASPLSENEAEAATIGYRSTKGLLEESKANDKKPFYTLIHRPVLHTDGKSLTTSFSQNWALAFRLTEEEKGIVERIEQLNKDKIKNYFEVSQGYIPYRLSDLEHRYGKEKGNKIKNERMWHSKNKVDESYIQEIKGENISKYKYHATGEYVKYGKHVGTYVDMKYFSSPRLLVREIVNPLIACYVEETFVNDPQLIDVISRTDNTTWSLGLLWAILNSKLSSYYVTRHSPKATKGIFPKILISDINNFPLPVIGSEEKKNVADNITALVNDVAAKTASGNENSDDVKQEEEKINVLVCRLYGLDKDETNVVINS